MRSLVVRAVIVFAASVGLLATSSLSAVAAPAGGPDYAAIDSYVANSLAGTPGFALSIVHGDQVAHTKAFGIDGGGSPVTADTPFVIGSETKSFTALGIMQLKESGALDLDAPVQSYLRWFRVADPTYSREITIRQLLNQTSGLPPSAPFETSVTSVESRVRDLASIQLPSAPGRLFHYSNSNYDTLGLVIEAVSGRSYSDYMQQHVFTPLNMNRSYASESSAKTNGLALGHAWWFGAPIAIDTYRSDFIPACCLVSTAHDMSHYLIAQLNGGTYAGAQVVSAEGIAEMHRGAAPGEGLTYGMGWFDDVVNGVPVVAHDGDALTFHTDMILVPSTGWGVELIANASSLATFLPAPINATAKGVVSMLMGQAPPFTPSPLDIYIVFDVLVMVVIGFQIWSLVRVLSNPAKPAQPGVAWVLRHLIAPSAWRVALAVAACVGVFVIFGGMLGASPLLVAETDLGAPVLAVSALLLVNGVLRTARAYGSMRSRNSARAVSVASSALQEAAS
jgi:CubicO group peptidase (beta-lactamase class C family)